MPKKLSPEQYWNLFKKLPKELRALILSEETAKDIYEICDRNDVDVLKVPEVARCVGDVILGILPPDKLSEALEKEVRLKKEVAKKVVQEINRIIFFPVKGAIEELYRMPAPAQETPSIPLRKPSTKPPVLPEKPSPEVPPKPPPTDIYREPIE